MKLVGKTRRFKRGGSDFRVSYYHRVALGLETGTSVYMVAVPRPEGAPVGCNELMITTVDPARWDKLWRLAIVLPEATGQVRTITGRLHELGANVSILETVTTEAHRMHSILAVLDMSGVEGADDPDAPQDLYSPESDQHVFTRRVKEVLFADPVDERFEDFHKPTTFSRLNRLFAAALSRRKRGYQDSIVGEVKDGSICFKKPDFDQLMIEAVLPSGDVADMPSRYLLFSDTEEKHITCYFPSEEEILMRASITHTDQPGAILSFAEAFKDCNIINSYSRLQRTNRRAQWKVTLALPPDAPSCKTFINKAHGRGEGSSRGEGCAEGGTGSDLAVPEEAGAFTKFDELELSYTEIPPKREDRLDFGYVFGRSEPKHFFGRQSLIEKITHNCMTEGDNYLLSGYTGTGKTALMKRILTTLSAKPGLLPVMNLRVLESSTADHGGRNDSFWWALIASIHYAHYTATMAPAGAALRDMEQKLLEFFQQRKYSTELNKANISKDYFSDGEPFTSVLRRSIQSVKDNGRRVVILLDDFQRFLDPGKAPDLGGTEEPSTAKGPGFAGEWKAVLDEIPETSWIVASTAHCMRPIDSEGEGDLRLSTCTVGRLRREAAERLVTEPFENAKIHVSRVAAERILHLTCQQPYYAQTLCKQVGETINEAPMCVDVITRGMVDRSARPAAKALESHFRMTYKDLLKFCHQDVLNEILEGGANEITRSRHREMRSEVNVSELVKDGYITDLGAIPGLCLGDDEDLDSPAFPSRAGRVRATPLFSTWFASRRS